MKVVDLFCGIGGFRLALEKVFPDAEVVMSCDIDEKCRSIYRKNFGDTPRGDIKQLSINGIPDHDMLTAGFPCPSFSIAGVSKMKSIGQCIAFENEKTGSLFFEITRILEKKKPRLFLLENVENLQSVKKGKTFQIIRDALRMLGYGIHYDVLDARDFGLPQKRRRIFIVGFRDDLVFSFPKGDRSLTPKLRNLLEDDVPEKYTISDATWERLKKYKRKHQLRGHGFGYQMVNLDGSAYTLVAHYAKDPHTNLVPQKGRNPRRFTPRECLRLMGFPEDFRIPSINSHAYRQLGNSVPIPVVEAVMEEIKASLVKGMKKKRITDYFR